MWRTAREENRQWIEAEPARFFMPAYVGPCGWAGLHLDRGRVDWHEVDGFVRDSYRLAASKRLATSVAEANER